MNSLTQIMNTIKMLQQKLTNPLYNLIAAAAQGILSNITKQQPQFSWDKNHKEGVVWWSWLQID